MVMVQYDFYTITYYQEMLFAHLGFEERSSQSTVCLFIYTLLYSYCN